MSTVPNFAGNFLGGPPPLISNFPAIASPWGTFIKPGGRVAAYVRSTGAQDGEDHFAASGMLVSSINEGLKRCRSGQNDIVFVLPGHAETYSSTGAIWANLVAGAQIIGCGTPGATNNPTLTLSHAGASMDLSVANVTVAGLNIVGGVATATGTIVVTAAGVTLSGNYINAGGFALGANPLIAVTGAANFMMSGNHVIADCTDPIVEVTGAGSTNLLITGNLFRQAQGTSGGVSVSVANTTGISGMIAYNLTKTASAQTVPAGGVTPAGTNVQTTLGLFENYAVDNVNSSGALGPAVAT